MSKQELEEGQIVLCTVEKILGTTVFVKIQDNGEGTITTSEISPGRIRNLRDYVVPGKKIVCKILRIQENRIHLSLRRVKQTEKKELLEKIAKERSSKAIFKTVLGKEKAQKVLEDITKQHSLLDFIELVKEKPKELEKYTTKQEAEKIIKIIESKKEKPKELRQKFTLSSKSEEGINKVKKIIQESCKGTTCNITYLAAGKYRITLKGEDFKGLKTQLNTTLESIEKQAKKQDCEFETKKN